MTSRAQKDAVLEQMREWRRKTTAAMWKANARKNAEPEWEEAAQAWNNAVRMINEL